MSELIHWPRAKYWDKAWNPIVGCHPCSSACDNCYARAWARRFGQGFTPHVSSHANPPRSGVVFCGNLTDLFGEWMWPWRGSHEGYIVRAPEDLIAKAVGKSATYLWLTKRVVEMCRALTIGRVRMLDEEMESRFVPLEKLDLCNHYFGFTAEIQQWFDRRFNDIIQQWPNWANLWVSCEPLLGPINLRPLFPQTFQWIVVGCESGPARRPCKVEWVESIVEQARSVGIPVFVKQLDINGRCETDINKFPAHLRIRQVPWTKKGGAK